jgi:hypothetical protein
MTYHQVRPRKIIANKPDRRILHGVLLFFGTLTVSVGTAQPTTWTVKDGPDQFFRQCRTWLGGDAAASVALGNGKVLWLFGDSFIALDSSASRERSVMVRNSIAIQDGKDPQKSTLEFFHGTDHNRPADFFTPRHGSWFWPGHGVMVRGKLILFLMEVQKVDSGLGFEVSGWYVAMVHNPQDNPSAWKINYQKGIPLEGPMIGSAAGLSSASQQTIAGSAQVFIDEKFLYALGATEPGLHEVFPLRWPLDKAYAGDFSDPEIGGSNGWIRWRAANADRRKPARDKESKHAGFSESAGDVGKPIFTAQTEYALWYDSTLQRFIQVQSFGFGKATIGVRYAPALLGPWTEPVHLFTPDYQDFRQPLMYSVLVHPEQKGPGIYLTYNVNSGDFSELLRDPRLYYPRFFLIKAK